MNPLMVKTALVVFLDTPLLEVDQAQMEEVVEPAMKGIILYVQSARAVLLLMDRTVILPVLQ